MFSPSTSIGRARRRRRKSPQRATRLSVDLMRRLRSLPGVTSVATASFVLFPDEMFMVPFELEGETAQPSDQKPLLTGGGKPGLLSHHGNSPAPRTPILSHRTGAKDRANSRHHQPNHGPQVLVEPGPYRQTVQVCGPEFQKPMVYHCGNRGRRARAGTREPVGPDGLSPFRR